MANSVKLTVVGYNGVVLPSSKSQLFTLITSTSVFSVTATSNSIMYAAGARAYIAVSAGPGSTNANTNWYVSETLDAINTLINTGQVTGVISDVASGGTITAAQIAGGIINFTGAVGALALPTTTDLGTYFNAVKGTQVNFLLSNTSGTGTCTLTVGSGTTAVSALTGGTTLTLANSATAGMAQFRYTFISATVAVLSRIF